MPQAKDKQILCHIEHEFHEIAVGLAEKKGVSTSAYIRNLVLNDLLQSGLISAETVLRVTS